MKNYNMKNLIFILFIFLLNCKKESQKDNFNLSHTVLETNDTITIGIANDYLLIINKNKQEVEKLNYFQPILNELINENSYAQILYEKSNIIINLEIGQNADVYEDIYLSKTNPLILEKIVRTTINKISNTTEKIVCEEKIDKPLTLNARYKTIDDNFKKCKNVSQP